MDAAFNGAGKKAGLELWRIEKLAPVRQPEVNGKFHVGDSYILLNTIANASGGFTWNIHFWLGAETSQDESGVAAYKTVELDEGLGGGPVQYREVQGNESATFLAIFKKTGGIEYLPGGVESGFRKVERDVWPTRLLQVKGKKTVRVSEVPLAASSLNKGDVFILDAGLKLFVFNGPTSNRAEKTKGLEVVTNINNDSRGGRAELTLIHEDPQNKEFWDHLGGYQDPNSLPEGESDEGVTGKHVNKMFRISDASGSVQFDEVPTPDGKLKRDALNGDDVFLVHTANKLFLWIGKKSTLTEKKESMSRAVEYIKSNGLPNDFSVERVSEGNETSAFKAEFFMWNPPKSFGFQSKASAAPTETPADVQALLSRKAAEDAPVDDGSGKLQVWVIENNERVEVPENQHGFFFGGDCYILLYTYTKNRSEEYLIYFWLGNSSTPDERGAAALLTVALDDSMGGKPVQVRVTQGKEPAHFRQLFKGKMVVYSGGRSKGDGGAGAQVDDVALFHIRGTNATNTMAVQVPAVASSLNSTDAFSLVSNEHVHAWIGGNANADEMAVAEAISTTFACTHNGKGGRAVVTIKEGEEPEEFWNILGGKTEYASVGPGEQAPRDPRLFSASTATGSFKVEEVDQFDQTDLNDEDVFLLDTFTSLFVWVGSQSSATEKEKSMEFAARYIAEANDGRDTDMPIIRVTAGQEPAMFSCHFHAWDGEFTKKNMFVDPYQAKLDAIAAAKAKKAAEAEVAAPAPAAKAAAAAPPAASPKPVSATPKAAAATPAKITDTYSFEELKANPPPAGVDVTRKEEYMDDATFQAVFGMDKAALAAMPKWKRDGEKKKHGLF